MKNVSEIFKIANPNVKKLVNPIALPLWASFRQTYMGEKNEGAVKESHNCRTVFGRNL